LEQQYADDGTPEPPAAARKTCAADDDHRYRVRLVTVSGARHARRYAGSHYDTGERGQKAGDYVYAANDPFRVYSGNVRGVKIPSHGEDIAAISRHIKKNKTNDKNKTHDHNWDRQPPVDVPASDKSERGVEAGNWLGVRYNKCQSFGYAHCSQRSDKRGNFKVRDTHAVEQAYQNPHAKADEYPHIPRVPHTGLNEIGGVHSRAPHYRADRQIDAAGEYHERHAQGQQTDYRRDSQDVSNIIRAEKVCVERPHDNDQNNEPNQRSKHRYKLLNRHLILCYARTRDLIIHMLPLPPFVMIFRLHILELHLHDVLL
jgi:hypothetical protein